jgi:CheY-like chemotaxis protein
MSLNTNKNLKEQITKGLEHLHTIVNGNTQKVSEVVATFVTETPVVSKQLQEFIGNDDMAGAAGLLPKAKVRYGYLGLDDTLADLTNWEEQLSSGTNSSTNLSLLKKFNELNDSIIKELTTTPYYQNGRSAETKIFENKCVLIAEDDEINAMVFELFVKELGASVLIARNGNEALQLSLEMKPDMIFMDVHMPFLSGLEVIKRVRSKGITCPIVSLSASTRLNEKQNSLDAGANDFLVKPANRDSINKALVKYLS